MQSGCVNHILRYQIRDRIKKVSEGCLVFDPIFVVGDPFHRSKPVSNARTRPRRQNISASKPDSEIHREDGDLFAATRQTVDPARWKVAATSSDQAACV